MNSPVIAFRTNGSASIGLDQPYYERLDFKPGRYPEAERYYAEAISLPMYPGLAEAKENHVIESLKSALFFHSI